jgi:hypothetical protein
LRGTKVRALVALGAAADATPATLHAALAELEVAAAGAAAEAAAATVAAEASDASFGGAVAATRMGHRAALAAAVLKQRKESSKAWTAAVDKRAKALLHAL